MAGRNIFPKNLGIAQFVFDTCTQSVLSYSYQETQTRKRNDDQHDTDFYLT